MSNTAAIQMPTHTETLKVVSDILTSQRFLVTIGKPEQPVENFETYLVSSFVVKEGVITLAKYVSSKELMALKSARQLTVTVFDSTGGAVLTCSHQVAFKDVTLSELSGDTHSETLTLTYTYDLLHSDICPAQ